MGGKGSGAKKGVLRKPKRRFEYIQAVNNTGSFAKAAKMLGVTRRAIEMYFLRNGIKYRRIVVVDELKASRGEA